MSVKDAIRAREQRKIHPEPVKPPKKAKRPEPVVEPVPEEIAVEPAEESVG